MIILLYKTHFLLSVFYYLKSLGMFFILKEFKLSTSERDEDCCLPEFDALYRSTYVQMFQRVTLPWWRRPQCVIKQYSSRKVRVGLHKVWFIFRHKAFNPGFLLNQVYCAIYCTVSALGSHWFAVRVCL